MRFKKGDRVRYTAAHAGYSQSEHKGREGTVADDCGGDMVNVTWDGPKPRPFEAVYRANIQLLSAFKVGDKVREAAGSNLGLSEHWRTYWAKPGDAKVTEFFVTGVTDKIVSYSATEGGRGPAFETKYLELVEDNWDFDPRKLKVEAGKFYKTRDGRKVGPMVDSGGLFDREYPFTIDTSFYGDGYGKAWRADGTFLPNKDTHVADLVAEWTSSCAAAQVDNLRDEYGPFTKAEPAAGNDNGKPKFKVGDRVVSQGGYTFDGSEGTVVEVNVNGDPDLFRVGNIEHPHANGTTWSHRTNMMRLVSDIATTPAIVALIENGLPRPATEPHVHPSRGHAGDEAGRLARKYPGKEFGVYELVDTRQVAVVYDHEWKRLAAEGEKIPAIKAIRDLTGMTLKGAKDAVEHWLATAA